MRSVVTVRSLIFVLLVAVAGVLVLFAGDRALAMSALMNDYEGTPPLEHEYLECDDVPSQRKGAILGYIVPCISYTIERSTIDLTQEVVGWLRPLLYAFMAFVIIIFGLKLLQQEPEVHKQGFILLIKVTIVAMVLNDLGGSETISGVRGESELIHGAFDILDETQSVIADVLISSPQSVYKCDFEKFGGSEVPGVWKVMDCVTGKLVGFVAGAEGDRPNLMIQAGIFGLLSGFLFGGIWGVTIFFAIIGVLLSLFKLVVRTVVSVLSSYLIICLMFVLMPLLLPLLFLRVTANYAEPVFKNILGAFIMPVIVIGYSVVAFSIYDQILFRDDSLLRKLTREAIAPALKPAEKLCDKQVLGDVTAQRSSDGTGNVNVDPTLRDQIKSGINSIIPTLTGANDLCAGARAHTIDLKMINDPAFKTGDVYGKLFSDLVKLMLIAYVLIKGGEALQVLVGTLTGGASGTRSAFTELVQPGEQVLDRAQAAAQREANNTFRDTKNEYGVEQKAASMSHQSYGEALSKGRDKASETAAKAISESRGSAMKSLIGQMTGNRNK
jgi:type IV secretory pathway VirB6-like protein